MNKKKYITLADIAKAIKLAIQKYLPDADVRVEVHTSAFDSDILRIYVDSKLALENKWKKGELEKDFNDQSRSMLKFHNILLDEFSDLAAENIYYELKGKYPTKL